MSETTKENTAVDRDLFMQMLIAHQHYRGALDEVAEWNEELKDDTGGYRGAGPSCAADRLAEAREEYREAFDAYIAARFGLTSPAR